MSSLNFATPPQLNSINGRWGYSTVADDCCCTLDELGDVLLTDPPGDGDVLCYDSTLMKWVNCPPPGCDCSLDELTDVTILNPLDCQVLQYDSTDMMWRNQDLKTIETFVPTQPNFTRGLDTFRLSYQMPRAEPSSANTINGSDIYDQMLLVNGDLSAATNLIWTISDSSAKARLQDPADQCLYLSISCLQKPRLRAGAISNGSIGINFRLSRGTSKIFFQQRCASIIGPLDGWLPYTCVVTESDCYFTGDNCTPPIMMPPFVSGFTYALETCIYTSPNKGSTEVGNPSITNLFELEPYWVITKHYSKACCP